MARNWQDMFQDGQGLSRRAVSQLSGIEVDLATALAFVNGGSIASVSGGTIMGCGDSRLQDGWSASRPNCAIDGRAILAWAVLFSQGRLTLLGDTTTGPSAATGGLTTAQILATEVPLVLALKPDFVVVCGAANDFAGSVPFATTLANFKTILDTFRAAGITPIVMTDLPRLGPPANLRALNAWLRRYAQAHHLPFADGFGAVVDTTGSGQFLAANTFDGGGHPSAAGAKLVGQAIANAVSYLPKTAPLADNNTVVAGDTVDRWSALTNNALLLTDTNSDGTPDGYNVPSSGTCDLTTSSPTVGKHATLTRAATDVALRTSSALTGFNNGDVCHLAFEVETTVKASSGAAGLYLDRLGDSSHLFAGFNAFTEDIPSGSVWSQIFTYDDANNDARLEIFAETASGAKVGFGRAVLLNLTQAGVASV